MGVNKAQGPSPKARRSYRRPLVHRSSVEAGLRREAPEEGGKKAIDDLWYL